MANWIANWRRKRNERIASGEPMTDAERDQYKSGFEKAGRLVGLAIAKATGRREASTIAEKTGAKVGEHFARDMERRIDRNRNGRPENS